MEEEKVTHSVFPVSAFPVSAFPGERIFPPYIDDYTGYPFVQKVQAQLNAQMQHDPSNSLPIQHNAT